MNLKNQKGITMVAEVLTMVIFVLLIGTITYSSMSSFDVRDLNNMYADILTIQEKASNYYLKYGEAPIDASKNIAINLLPGDFIANPNDDENEYYVVDFTKLLNVSLNREVTAPDLIDLSGESGLIGLNKDGKEQEFYFINAKTLTVYNSSGVEIDGLINREVDDEGNTVYTDETQVHYTLPSNYSNINKIQVENYR